ncbi:SDR family NAD(P)-dependent oxidoreductase [Allosphingosinicella deserti]|uniref:SDR family oxidoreductase n=1 Tax=Allosphingosinicella deserti TaxID=2116704 RepID=A0A2P7QKG7_9SPHN|nr:SDR family oxidoreductase [Sphingomonas deserti]PSJ38454.1 SDR family oxidoreductase [Sphingomonas deserti]
MTKGTALITGASTGIGATYADRLARRGYDLILVARDEARLDALAERLRSEAGRTIDVLPADLTDPVQRTRIEQRIDSDPALTLLVNNAGMSLEGTLATSPAETLVRLVALNVTAPTLLAAAAARAFVSRKAGAIINLSSVLALAPEMFDGTYSATKAFILTLSQGLAHEVGGSGVHVQAVLPGATRTEIWARSGKDVDAFPPEMVMEVGDLVDAALAGFDRGEVVTIPPLHDDWEWQAMQRARLALAPQLSRREVAPRYRAPANDEHHGGLAAG